MTETIIELKNISKSYDSKKWFSRKPQNFAVDDVSFDVARGETFGIVGESGSGKTTIAHMMVGILKPDSGNIKILEHVITDEAASKDKMTNKIQFVFQDPYGSLNPKKTVGWSIEEALHIHNVGPTRERKKSTLSLMARVGLSESYYDRYPHQLSGGQRQRVAIASSLIMKPEILVIDEGVSALDVSIQASILNLLNTLKSSMDLTLVFITHDLNVVQYFCDRVAVVKDGELKEIFNVDAFETDSHDPYTTHLFQSILED